MLIRKLRSVFNPEEFQGHGRKSTYFEGWYYKIVSPDEQHSYAVIPGIAIDGKGAKHAFIQVFDGKKRTALYHRFGFDEFSSASGKFSIQIANNHFSAHELRLKLPGMKGNLHFPHIVRWPNKWFSPGIMGPFTFLPLMECYHGIVSMNHVLQGTLELNSSTVDFTNGLGYTEKDWGHSFPSAYVWMQSNHFSKPGHSIKISVAKIPYLSCSFVGFIAGLLLGDELIQFTTYNQSRLKLSLIDNQKVELWLQNRKYDLRIFVKREESTELASPILGLMEGRIEESMHSEIQVRLTLRHSGEVIFEDTGRNAGLEVAGNIPEIILTQGNKQHPA